MGKIVKGSKISTSHTTYIEAARDLIKALEKEETVIKIALGKIKGNLPNGQHRIKTITLTGGLKIVVRGSHSIQEIFVYCKEFEKVQQLVESLSRSNF